MILTKLCASGNDFLIFHTFKKDDFSNLAKQVCERRYGVGADGLIVLIPHSKYDFEWLFYNADGSIAEMCGNGARAASLYAKTNFLAGNSQKFLTLAGVIESEVFEDNEVKVTLTKPQVIGLTQDGYLKLNTGVPHLTKRVFDIENFDIEEARELRYKHNSNVNIFKLQDGEIFVRTYERGVEDETLACGTGMAACVYSVILDKNSQDTEYIVRPKSGEKITIKLENDTLSLKGLVSIVATVVI